MSPKKRRAGRPTDEVDLNRFRKTLNLVEGNPNKWSLKNEWIRFAKLYFQSERIRLKQTKS